MPNETVQDSLPSYVGASFGVSAPSQSRKRKIDSLCSPSSPWYLSDGCPNFASIPLKVVNEDPVKAVEDIIQSKKRARTSKKMKQQNSNSDILDMIKSEKDCEKSLNDEVFSHIVQTAPLNAHT